MTDRTAAPIPAHTGNRGRGRIRPRLLAVVFVFLAASVVQASAKGSYETLVRLLDAGRYDEARTFAADVAASQQARAFNRQFIEALIAKHERHFARAASLMQELLDRDPSQAQLRFELAHVYFLMADDDRARYHFEYLRQTVHSPQVSAACERFLHIIRNRRRWSLNAAIGFAPSTNINDGTLSDTVLIGGVPFVSSNAAQSGVGLSWALNGSYRFDPDPRWALRIGGSLTGENYRTSRFDTLRSQVFAQVEHDFAAWHGAAGISVDRTMTGWHGYSTGAGPYLSFRKDLGRAGLLSGQVSWKARRYDRISAYDGSEARAGLSYRRILSPRLSLGVSAAASKISTQKGFTSYTGLKSGLTVDYLYNADYLLHAEASHEVRLYEANFPLTGKERVDEWTSVGGGVTFRSLAYKGYVPRIDYSYELVRSNVDLFDRSTHSVRLGISKRY